MLSHTWNPADHFHRCMCLIYIIDIDRDMITMLTVMSFIAHRPQTLRHVFPLHLPTKSFCSSKLSSFLCLSYPDCRTVYPHTHIYMYMYLYVTTRTYTYAFTSMYAHNHMCVNTLLHNFNLTFYTVSVSSLMSR